MKEKLTTERKTILPGLEAQVKRRVYEYEGNTGMRVTNEDAVRSFVLKYVADTAFTHVLANLSDVEDEAIHFSGPHGSVLDPEINCTAGEPIPDDMRDPLIYIRRRMRETRLSVLRSVCEMQDLHRDITGIWTLCDADVEIPVGQDLIETSEDAEGLLGMVAMLLKSRELYISRALLIA
jgi:hypothetical protein